MNLVEYSLWTKLKPLITEEMVEQLALGDSYMPREDIATVQSDLNDYINNNTFPDKVSYDLKEALFMYRNCNYFKYTNKDEIVSLLACIFLY